MSADTRKKIYDILKNKTGFMDSYEDFDNDMTTSEDARKKVYEVLIDKTGFNDTYENFVSGISGEVQRESAIPPVKEESGNVVTTVQSPSYPQRVETKERILNNIPDYFQSKGTNLSTLPLPQNTMSAEKPADIPERIVQDEQQRIQLAERAANDPYMKQQELEHVFKPKNQEQIDSVRQLINSARQQRVKERQQRVKSAGGGGIFSTMSQAYLAGEQNDTDKELEYASTLIEQAQNITNEAKRKGNTNFFAGFARGFKDAPLDGWAMGLQDLKNYSAAKKVMDKVDRGEELSPSEDALMQALVTNAATQMYYSGDLGRGYKAGGVTAESLPFMLDMIAGMGTIQAVTKPASKALVKYATEKAAKMGLGRATTGLAKGAARTAAGLGDVAAHTATFGGARVAADYQRRGLGGVQVSPEQDGTVSYAGRDNVQTGAEAIGKSVVSTAAETGSELLGEYFAPMLGWIGKVTGANRLGKIIPASVGNAYSSIINSNGFKQVQEIARRAKIADPIGEYGEEVVNNLVSTAIGDMTPEQLVDLDNNIDTFLGVAPMSALFGAAGTGGYLREKYRNYRNMREFENQMRDTMGEDWSGVREALQDADIETARGMVKDVLSSDMQPDIKKKAINYISSVLQEQTLQEADKQIAPEEMIQNKRFIISNLNEARNNIGIGEEELNSAVSILNQEGESALSELYDAETVQKIVEYKNAYDDYLNYTYWVQNQAYDARKEAESQVERMTNATTGTVMRVKSGLSKNPVNILRGNIVFDAEGNVDKDSSDNTIYYLSEDGKVKMAPISMFESLIDDTPADELSYQAGEDAEQEFIQNEEAQIMQPEQSVQPIELGTTFQSDGVTYSVTQKSPDGYVVSALDEEGNPVQSNLLTEEQIRTAMTPAIQEEQTSQEQFVQNEDITQPEQQQLQNKPQTAISRIPVNENGEHDFESAPYQDTSSALIEISENVDDAKDTAAQMINHYQEELKKADKAKTTGNTIQEIVRLKQQKKENIQSINDKIAYWNSVANDIESKRPGGIIEQAKEESDANQQRLSEMTAEQQKAAQEEVQKKIDSGAYERKEPRKRVRYVNEDNDMGTANTPMEHVLREIATGRVTFKWNDSGETQGLGSHLGLASSPEERRRMIWALSSDGMTPEAAAEQIHADMPENLQGMVTDQDVFNMILDAFHQNGTPSKMWESAKSMHGTDVEESAPGYEDYMEQQALEWEASQNNMTVEEWISYCDYIEEELDNMYSSVSDEDLNAIFERFNEQIISENESRGNETEGAGSTEGQTDGEQGDGLLPEGRGNNEGTDTTVNEQPEPANQTDGESSSVVSESEGAVKTEIETARQEVDQNPTEAQKEAGNYKKGHVKVDGFDITIENPKGSVRSGKDADGKEWSVTMNNDYGYIRGTEGVDGDHIDVFLSDNPEQGNVYVIDQVNQKTGEYDESKVMYGFNSLEEAKDAYLANFEEGWKVGVVSGVSKEEFRKWIESSVRKTKPFSEYKSVKVEEAQNEGIRPDEGVLDYAKRVAEREQKKAKPAKKIDVFSYTDAKSNIPAYRGAYYSDGTVTATNGFTLIRLQATYPRENEGKVIDKKGEEVANVRYPKVELIIPKGEQETVTVDKESVRAKLNEIETKLKEEWEKSDKKTPYKTLKAITTVKVNIGGVTHNMSLDRLAALLDGMDAIGSNQVGITKTLAYAKNGKQLIAVAFNAKDIDDTYDNLSISDETYSEDTINQMKRVGVPLTDLEGIPKSEDGMFQIYGIQNVVGETMYFVSSPGKTVKNMDENYVGTGDRMFKSLDEAIKGAEEERASYQRTKADREEREERVRQRIEEERKAQEAKDATPLGKFLKTLNRLQAGKADGVLSDNVSFNGETMSKADFIQRVIADGYAAEEYLDGTKIKYRLVKDGKGYKINKTEFDFAKFAGAETIEVENKDDLINLERLSRKYADKGVYTMADIDKRIASTERRLKGTNENGKEGKELKKALEELNELKRLKEMHNSTRTKQEEKVDEEGNTILFREEGNPDTRFRFIGEQGAANLDRVEEATTRLDNLNVAREMEKSGKDAKSIKIATGWERGADNKWRYEEEDFEYIPKGNAREKSLLEREPWHKELMSLSDKVYNGEKLSNEEEVRFDELSKKETELKDSLKKSDIKFLDDYVSDNTLFKEYPELKQVKVEFYDGSFFDGGSYSHHDMTIRINNNSPLDAKSILVHEVQHAIQHIEGFSRGGNSRTYRNYLNSLKEKRDAWSMIDEFEEKSKELGSDASKMDVYKAVRDEYTSLGMSFGDGIMPSRDSFDKGFNLWARGYDKEGYEDAYKEYQNLIEKFGLGESKDRYHELSGEVEARNVQSRLNMTPEERRSTLASETEDVAREDQIFLYDSMGASSMVIDANQIAESLNVPVQVINSIDEVPEGAAKEAIQKGRKVKGWYDVKTGKVYVYLPNATSAEDVKQTILHEGIAHFGLRQLVGEERMDDFLDEVFRNVSKEIRNKIVGTLPKYGYDSRVATEEYLARMAESGVDVSTWERIKQAFKNLLRRIGINIQINDNELKYILWRSAHNLDKNRPIDLAIDVAMQYNMGVGNYFREGESDGSREEYENSLQGWKFKAREAYQDSMLALKNLQEIIAKVSGKPIKSFEDAYTFENQLSSKNTSESEKYYDEFFVPLLNAEGKLIKKYGLTHKEIERYMMLAHGIERNVEMTFREQLNEIIKENPDEAQQFIQDFKDEKEKLRAKYSGYEYLKALSDYMGEVGDFSATEAILKSMDNEEHADFQNDALDYVKDFEGMYDVKELWGKTNNATKETLKKSYESGMMDKDHFANVSKMFMYYVPLRGWTEETAEDVYEYINSERSPVNSVLKSMKGRKSVPDEVIATIGNMAESSILQGNRNLMKQAFMNMVVNHPTDVATLRKAWYVYNPVEDEWSISMPEIEENDTPEKIAEKIKNHDEKMKQLKEQGLATQKSKGLNIDYRIMKNNISQHAVIVKNGGKDFVIYVNGNPRAAQAVNGLTNPDAEKNPIFNAISRANRWLAANFTTRNPAFVMSNLSRDLIFSTTAVWIKEDAKYSSRFRKNILTALPTVVKGVMGKGKDSEADKYFREFVENGGETGYMYLNDVDAYKKKVRKELARITGERGRAKRAMDYTIERLEDFNRMAEDISRFAVYMTSRQMGRSIVESVRDAKEITVNFNKKGAGYNTGGFFGLTAGAMRNLYLFFNASVQSLTNFNRLRVKNPVKFYSVLGGFMTAGMIIPVVNNLLYSMIGGGDDNPYNDLPEWVRRNNLCIYAGNGQFVTIPLPIELRAFYGLGDYAYQLSTGREKPTPTGIAKGTVSQLADLLPLNPTGNEGFKTFVPDALAPVFETYVWNKDFTGKPIAKLTPFNERDPEWKRVYKGTSGWLVDASKFFNDLTNGGGPGSDFRKGVIDFNPAKVENLLESYFGGMAKFLNQSGKTLYYGAKSIAEGEMDDNLTARNVPVLNRFYNKIDDRNAFAGINTDYFKLRDEMEQFKYELNGVKKNYRNNPEEYRQIVNSDMFRKYMRYKPYQDRLDRLYKMAKELEGQDRKQVEDMIVEIRRELVNSLK